MTKTNYDIIVIGAGSAGLTAAIGSAGIGAKVLLIEKHKIGGDCTHYGCIPSKTLIKAAKVAKTIKKAEKFGIGYKHKNHKENLNVDLKTVLKSVEKVINTIYKHETPEIMKKYGINVEIGNCKFKNKNSISINNKTFSAKKIIIATGSHARVPKIPGIENINYLTNKEIFQIKDFKSLIVLGAGPIGCELGQAFADLGVEVTLINRSDRILPREDDESREILKKQFKEDGIKTILNAETLKIEQSKSGKKTLHLKNLKTKKDTKITADEILIATGRVPNTQGLNLEAAGIEYNEKGIKINKSGRTTNKKVFAIGDVSGGMQFTHLANAQGKTAIANAIFHLNSKYEENIIPKVTFTIPEIASIGINEHNKEEKDIVLKKNYEQIDRAVTDLNTTGFFKIIVNEKGHIKGATLVGEGAGELIGEIALAMKTKTTIDKLANTIHPYPTYGYGLRNTADQFLASKYTKKKKKFVMRLLGLRGKL